MMRRKRSLCGLMKKRIITIQRLTSSMIHGEFTYFIYNHIFFHSTLLSSK
jgi:hypothetical protein